MRNVLPIAIGLGIALVATGNALAWSSGAEPQRVCLSECEAAYPTLAGRTDCIKGCLDKYDAKKAITANFHHPRPQKPSG